MPTTTENYGLTTGIVTDDVVQPEHQNRVAETLDQALGFFLRQMMADGAYSGWGLNQNKQVEAGEGLVAGCWCKTTSPEAITNLSNGSVNYVFAGTDATSAPSGTVAFFAQTTETKPAGAVYLGTMELDGDGNVVALDENAPRVDRNCYRLEIQTFSGSGSVAGVPGGGEVEVTIDHSDQGAFRLLGPIVVEASEEFEWEVLENHEASQFRLRFVNTSGDCQDLSYTWTREGLRV